MTAVNTPLHKINPGEELILWCDFETNGLVARSDYPLEIAAIITDLDYNIVSREFHHVIQYSREEVAAIKEQTNEYVTQMHETNGLWDNLPNGTPKEEVAQLLLEFVREYAPEPRQARLGGNSCTLDINFLEYHFNETYEHLHYRILDISSLAYLLNVKHGVPIFPKKLTHRALDDIKESIAEAKYLDNAITVTSM